jgi:hypothetical protein
MVEEEKVVVNLDLVDSLDELWDQYESRISPKELRERNSKFKKYSIFVFCGILLFWFIAYISFMYNLCTNTYFK